MTACYAEYFDTVDHAVAGVLRRADRETVVHEVFFRILTDGALRESFRGGSFRSWIAKVARNQAIDYWRRHQRERLVDSPEDLTRDDGRDDPGRSRLEACILVQRFRAERLPTKWQRLFEIRFLRQLDQSAAARELGISRTTLIYQEHRIRALLRRFLCRAEAL